MRLLSCTSGGQAHIDCLHWRCLSDRQSVSLSVCPSVRLYVRPSVCLSVCPSVCMSVRLSVRPSVRLSVRLSVCSSVCPSVRLSACPPVRPSLSPSVCLSVSLLPQTLFVHLLCFTECNECRLAFGGFISTDSNLVYSEFQTCTAEPADRTFLSDAGSPSLLSQ